MAVIRCSLQQDGRLKVLEVISLTGSATGRCNSLFEGKAPTLIAAASVVSPSNRIFKFGRGYYPDASKKHVVLPSATGRDVNK